MIKKNKISKKKNKINENDKYKTLVKIIASYFYKFSFYTLLRIFTLSTVFKC